MTYAKVCQRWGIDPAAPFSDDVLAHNVRVGLLVAMAKALEDEPGVETQDQIHGGKIITDLEEQMRAYVDR